MIARSLFQTNKYFASKFQLLTFRDNKYAIPSPPSRPAFAQTIFNQLLRNKAKEIGQKQADIKKNEQLFKQLTEQAKVERENALKNYETSLKEYEAKFSIPKRIKPAFFYYYLEKYDKTEKLTESVKRLSKEFKQLSEQEQKIYKEKAAEDKKRYQDECEKFVKQHQDLIVPSLYPLQPLSLYVSEQFSQNPQSTLKKIASSWKQLSEEQKKQYEEKVIKINEEQKQKLAEFQKKNNLSDEDIKNFKKRKQRSKSVEQKESQSQ
ncbi:HMG box protein (macronuclear) [Tetrahymena thermophila SB210]|uniref:HMG box protein n=1 Tax=Tetrahymena thermophila (strain SB210) TaxID=312017 RepID=I7M2Z3_TETTS|nr:HMG box protein [Tetrahymena thermophila SB210]EAS01753.1 HMG box protein [Tetrahymena thermophila SB210]|eukprot:XP_001021998.1 HMG box protein [Tetrahymena thermophila SB210]